MKHQMKTASYNIHVRNLVCVVTFGGLGNERITFIFQKVHTGSRVEGGFEKNETGVWKTSRRTFSTGFQVMDD